MHPNYTLAQKLIQKANLKGYDRGFDPMSAEYWWATKQYLEPEYAKLVAGDEWNLMLGAVVVLDENRQADFLARYL